MNDFLSDVLIFISGMQLTYIFHSGFAIETETCLLVFDCWLDPSGVMERLLPSPKPLYVLVSHFHEDHFSRGILRWRDRHPTVTYLFSKDILKYRRAKKEEADVWMAKGSVWQDTRVRVQALGSNDSGVSWVVEVEGRRIFHAGDLNNWYARFLTDENADETVFSKECSTFIHPRQEEKRYLGELKDIRKVAEHFDVVLFPVDGRIGNGYTRGARQFIERFSVGLFVPMHFVASGFQSAWRMKEFTEARQIPFWCIEREGETLSWK